MGDYIQGPTVEGDYAAVPKHHEKLDRALQKAVDELPEGPDEQFEVRYIIHVKHSSPGWVDGYSVRLVRPGA